MAADLKVPLYATPFTAGLIAGKLEEEGLTGKVKLKIIERGGSFDLDPFRVTYVPLAHSIPEGNGLLIETPFGDVFHTGDWKLDDTPVLGQPSSAETLTRIGDEGVLAMVCDSTNTFQETASGSEASVHPGLLEQVAQGQGPRARHDLRLERRAAADDRPRRGRGQPQIVRRRAQPRPHPQGRARHRLSARFPRGRSASTKRCACRATK